MKKRLNLKLVLWLVAGVVVLVVGVHLVHTWQVSRTATILLDRARAAREAGNLPEAYELYRKYVVYERDDVAAAVELANTAADLVEQQKPVSRQLVSSAFEAMESALRKDTDNAQIRRRLAKFVMQLRRFHDAKDHLRVLIKSEPDDPELLNLLATCHVALGEDDRAVEVLETTIEKAPTELGPYRLLADVFKSRQENPAAAAEVLDQMVEANPERWEAYWVRATDRLRRGDQEGSAADTEQAAELASDEPEVIVLLAEQASRTGDLEVALGHMQRGLELYPEDGRFYQGQASIERRRQRMDEAIAHLQKGLEVLPESMPIAWQLADFQLTHKDVAGARATIDKIAKMDFNADMVDLLRARLAMLNEQWSEARGLLERVRPLLARDNRLSLQVELMLALCYSELRQTDLAQRAADRALILDPTSVQARKLLAQQLLAKGNAPAALEELQRLNRAGEQVDPATALSSLTIMMRQELSRPAEQRNWQRLFDLLDQLEQVTESNVDTKVYRVELLYQSGQKEEAQALLDEQLEAHPNALALWLAKAGLAERESGIDAASAVLDAAQEQTGDSVRLRTARVSLCLREAAGAGDDEEAKKQVQAQLEPLATGMDSFSAADQAEVARRVAQALYRLKDIEGARRWFSRVAELDPQDIDARLSLFNLASEQQDDQQMSAALEELAKVAGGHEGSYWRFGEAVRLYLLARQAKPSAERDKQVAQARENLELVIKRRPEWADAIGLEAQLDELDGNVDQAIEKYQQAIELGGRRLQYFRGLTRLLAARGRYEEADQVMREMPLAVQQSLGHLGARLAEATGDRERAEKLAAESYDPASKNYRDHLFYARVLLRSNEPDEAEEVLQRALPLGQDVPEVWVTWVAYLVGRGRMDEARGATEEARGKLPADSANLALGKCYELLGNPRQAEQAYQAAAGARGDDLAPLRVLANYYLRTEQNDQAVEQLTGILKAASADPVEHRPSLAWSRRNLARLEAETGSYRDLQEALRLIDANAQNGQLEPTDMVLKGSLLANRSDRPSRLEAIRLFERVLEQMPNYGAAQLALAQLYERDQRWLEARRQFNTLCAQNPDNAYYKGVFVRQLVQHDELADAMRWAESLESTHPDSPQAYDAKSRVLAAQDRADEAIGLLAGLVPEPPLSPEKLPVLRSVGGTLLELAKLTDDEAQQQQYYQATEKYFRQLVEAEAKQTLVLADFLGRYGDYQESLELCEQALATTPAETVVRIGMTVLRERRDEVRPADFQRVGRWLEQAQQERPQSATLVLYQADLYDLLGQPAQAEECYRQVLASDNLNDTSKATALNNLAFVLAIRNESSAEALRMIQEAIELMGPMGELLDTRGMVRLAQGQVDEAIRDMEQSIAEKPSGVKYFHLAQAHLAGKNEAAAAEAWEKAKTEGLDPSHIPQIEKPKYQQLQTTLGLTTNP